MAKKFCLKCGRRVSAKQNWCDICNLEEYKKQKDDRKSKDTTNGVPVRTNLN